MLRFASFPIMHRLWLWSPSSSAASPGLITDVSVSTTPVSGGLTFNTIIPSQMSPPARSPRRFFVAVDTTANLFHNDRTDRSTCAHATDTVIEFSSPDSSLDIIPGSIGLFSLDSLTPVISTDAVAGVDANFNFVQNDGTILALRPWRACPNNRAALLCAQQGPWACSASIGG